MKKYKINVQTKKMLSDTITPVSIYLKVRDHFQGALLLESSDYRVSENSFSFICLQPIATFRVEDNIVFGQYPDGEKNRQDISPDHPVTEQLHRFIQAFDIQTPSPENKYNGLFGYATYDAAPYFETIRFAKPKNPNYSIPEMQYSVYKYVIAVNHFRNELFILENLIEKETGNIDYVVSLLNNRNVATYHFAPSEKEVSNLTDNEYMEMVNKGRERCLRGDVYQIVLSRHFSMTFTGDDINVYRALRSINPSPYLYYFDYGNYKIFGSSPESQLIVSNNKAYINPIAGTYQRTGDDERDKKLAEELSYDPKENAEHVMLVDLARNDLSRSTSNVRVEVYREVQYYSHVIHLVSKVSGELTPGANTIQIMADTFPAGTLSGAPKFRAMELIDTLENQNRGFYGGCIGHIGFNGDLNQAIMIRSFLSKNNTLFYQAGAGIVSRSKEETELNEVNTKLMALKRAILLAKEI